MVTTIDDDFTFVPKSSKSAARPSSNSVSGVSSAVDPTSFYGSSSTYNRQSNTNAQSNNNGNVQENVSIQGSSRSPPALPGRLYSTAGSSHTNYIAPQTSFGGAYREPVIVPNDDEQMPDLVSSSQFDPNAGANVWPRYSDYGTTARWSQPDFNSHLNPAHTWGADGDIRLVADTFSSDPPIDGRDMMMERRWWDPEVPGAKECPGPGMLPPLLVDALHHPDHSLVSVTVTPPEISTGSTSGGTSTGASSLPSSPSRAAASGTHSRSSSSSTSTSTIAPPSAEELLEAVPHPHAYYCRWHNGWVLLLWRSSSILPPLSSSFTGSPHAPLPNQDRRKLSQNCLQESRLENKTHHFHRYERAVDASSITPKYTPPAWERDVRLKQSRRRMTIGSDDLDPTVVAQAIEGDVKSERMTQMVTDAKEEEETHNLLDLYICCQCSIYVLVSDVIPGVIPIKTLDAFICEKRTNPPVGWSDVQSVYAALETLIVVIENKLWKGNDKMLSINGRAFSSKVGWNPTVQKLFESLGFRLEVSPPKEGTDPAPSLKPPDTDPSSDIGRLGRERLLRAWVEISARFVDLRRRFPSILKNTKLHKVWVQTENAREMYQTALGAHPDQIQRAQWPVPLQDAENLGRDWEKLGMTPSTYDSELLHFAYLAQCRCDPQNTPEYFQALTNIIDALRTIMQSPSSLETLVAAEKSRGRFASDDVQSASRALGFGTDNDLRVDYDEDLDDDSFLQNAWRSALRRSWADPEGAAKRRDLNEAFRILAESRRSAYLIKAFEDEQLHGMTPEKAYNTLEVPMGVDEEMLITVYNMRVEDQPSSLDKMREAMRVIAEFTCSERLQRFLETGIDPGVISAQTRPEWPRGLNQLGNTCYLNSLLQYFYTIKDLRDAIAPLAVEEKFMDSDKLKDDDLKHHRVGGRMVSRFEVVRSRKFVSQLANLFLQLENSDSPAVTPTLELAKLALVTSKDEEEDDAERVGTDSSNSTDATLVDEPAPLRDSASPQPKSPSPASSVLGKRPRSFGRRKSTEGVSPDDQDNDKDGFGWVSKASGSNTPVTATADPDGDISMDETRMTSQAPTAPKAPPLPPRPKASQYSGSDMLFGKQHDVAECMDNCMFQIETALLRFGELAGPDDNSKRSTVKRLFYGKIRQRLSVPADPKRSKSSMHEREDYFSHLPVNVSEESFDLYDGLSGYFAMEDDVDFEGTRAKMNVSLVELPPILQIQLQRVQFNRDTLQPYKSHAYVKFGETICMDRFLDDAPADKKARAKQIQAELNTCRERIHHLTQGKHAPFEQNLDNTYNFLSKQTTLELPEATVELKSVLQTERERVVNEIATLRARIGELKVQLEDVWAGEHSAEYELTGVFVHRGSSPTFGHYFIYQRWLPNHPDEWFKYNDSDVSVVDKSEVLADTTGSTANPYLLVFARKGSQVIQTVNRTDTMTIE